MGAVAAPGGRSSGKKSLNVELNLVPFIDLLTCLICFLLMAAVWIQIGKISVAQSGQGPPGDTDVENPDPVRWALAITQQGFIITGNGVTIEGGDILKKDNHYNFKRLGEKLTEVHGQHPETSSITVISEDGIKYQTLVNTFDICLANQFPNISVSGTI